MVTVNKPKLPKGLAYALKTALLQTALKQARIDCHVDLNYWTPQNGGSILEAHFWLPNCNAPYPRVYVRAGTVLSSEHRIALEALTRTALPAFIRWLAHLLVLPERSPLLEGELYFNATYRAGEVDITSAPHV